MDKQVFAAAVRRFISPTVVAGLTLCGTMMMASVAMADDPAATPGPTAAPAAAVAHAAVPAASPVVMRAAPAASLAQSGHATPGRASFAGASRSNRSVSRSGGGGGGVTPRSIPTHGGWHGYNARTSGRAY